MPLLTAPERIRFNEEFHLYYLDHRLIPGTTGIIDSGINKPYLGKWRGKHGNVECDRMQKDAAEFGHRMHAVVNTINRAEHTYGDNGAIVCDEELQPGVEAYVDWFHANVEQVIASETLTFSEKYWYAGTPDMVYGQMKGEALAKLGPGVILGDLKTSKLGKVVKTEDELRKILAFRKHPEWRAQTAAYAVTMWHTHGVKVEGRIIIHMPSDNPGLLIPTYLSQDTIKGDFAAFLGMKTTYHFLKDCEAGR